MPAPCSRHPVVGCAYKMARIWPDGPAICLRIPTKPDGWGKRAKQAVLANQGAARRHARVVAELVNLPFPRLEDEYTGHFESFFSGGCPVDSNTVVHSLPLGLTCFLFPTVASMGR